MWFLLRHSVTPESVNDVLGSRLLDWPGNLERRMRLFTLQGPLTIFLILFSAAFHTWQQQGGAASLRRIAYFTAGTLPWIALCGYVVFYWPNTSNIVELVRFRPFPWIGPVSLLALIALVAGNATWLSQSAKQGTRGWVLKLIVTAALVIPGWVLLHLGLNPAVEKYGLVFPAARFIFGPDRIQEISWLHTLRTLGSVSAGKRNLVGLGRQHRTASLVADDIDKNCETAHEHSFTRSR